MAPAFVHSIRSLITHAAESGVEVRSDDVPSSTEVHQLLARDKPNIDHGSALDPHDINNAGFFALFALLGVAFVLTGIWFFFWAKNGGFHFKETDWDDYKTTVMRRRGPNGTILSNATPSTNLGGGSIYKDMDDDTTTVVTESTGLSGITAGASDPGAREDRRRKQEKRDRDRKKRHAERKARRYVGEDGVEDDVAEKDAKQHLRSYRHERPARVGGLNKESEGSTWDGSTVPSESNAPTSELLTNRQSTPPRVTQPPAAIRKVYSTADRNADREAERMRAEARQLRAQARRERRDFSYTPGGGAGDSTLSESLLESNYTEDTGDLGTKSYHHPMPELRAQRQQEREERRARRGGYRRGRGEDSDI
jgi:hypothetical protein